jgi:hypothetical protein
VTGYRQISPVIQGYRKSHGGVRLTKSKKALDPCPNSIRAFARRGLKLYKQDRAVFFSRSDLVGVLRSLKLRGAHVSGMICKGDNSGWRLTIDRP